jgi:hypothetical protein
VRIERPSAELARRLRVAWAPFVAPLGDEPFLRVEVRYEPRGIGEGSSSHKSMISEMEIDSARFRLREGSASVEREGGACIRLHGAPGRREFFAFSNLLRACLAWRLPGRGGTLLHAAGLRVGGRAFVLVGAGGSGKSTWTRLGEEGGARALSDDLVLIDGAGPRLEALGSPFHSSHEADYRPGRWPLAAVLFPRHGPSASCRPVDALIARARLSANLPFLAEALQVDERVAALLDRFVRSTPCAELTFGLDSSFVSLLRDWPA